MEVLAKVFQIEASLTYSICIEIYMHHGIQNKPFCLFCSAASHLDLTKSRHPCLLLLLYWLYWRCREVPEISVALSTAPTGWIFRSKT